MKVIDERGLPAGHAPPFRVKRQRISGQPEVKIDDCSKQNSAYVSAAVLYILLNKFN